MAKKILKYFPKYLVNGSRVKEDGKTMVAVPDKGYKDNSIDVIFNGKHMLIKNWHKAVTFRRFHDKFGGSDYTLAYHEWKPE